MFGEIEKMLSCYKDKKRISFSMPGHKNKINYSIFMNDVTELEDTDNLYHSKGAVKIACENISKITSSDECFIMVNGSTGGIFTMLAATCKRGDKVLISRACHMSVVNACIVLGLCPVFFEHKIYERYSIYGEADLEDIEKKIDINTKAILVTSPNYYGIVSDIKGISNILDGRNIPLLVDEAHGGHYFVSDYFPQNAIELGADIVVQSMHKTLNGLNQSALLQVKSNIIDIERLRETITFFQTSSPSYPIAASAEAAIIQGKKNNEKWEKIVLSCIELKQRINRETDIKIPSKDDGFFDIDETRLVFNFSRYDISGYEVSDILRKKHNIDIEMSDSENIVLIVTAENTKEELDTFRDALLEISKEYRKNDSYTKTLTLPNITHQIIQPGEAFYKEGEYLPASECVGKISARVVMVYPPAIPVMMPGSEITEECIEYLKECQGEIVGMTDGKIYVIKE